MYTRLFAGLFTTLVTLSSAAAAVAQTGQPEIAFTVSMSKPHTHLLEIDMRIKRSANTNAPAEELLVMPVWTPGSYLVREFERHVQDFSAKDAAGQALK